MIGESEAKALLKGKLRIAQVTCDDILLRKQNKIENGYNKSLKVADKIFEETLEWYGDFLLSCRKFKRSSSKHWRSEYFAIEPELGPAKNVGNVCGFVFGTFDSRKFLKGEPSAGSKLQSHFYFHEHFLTRCIQRFGERSMSNIGWYIYPIIEWLVTENIPLSKLCESNYFVFDEFVLVAKKLEGSEGIVFITILISEFMTDNQRTFFFNAASSLKYGQYEFILVNDVGDIVYRVPFGKGNSLLELRKEGSYWLEDIRNKRDIRWDKKTFSELVEIRRFI